MALGPEWSHLRARFRDRFPGGAESRSVRSVLDGFRLLRSRNGPLSLGRPLEVMDNFAVPM